MLRNSLIALVSLASAFAASAQAEQEPVRSITALAGAVYRFQNDAHFGVFLVTEEGIIVCDPLNSGAASWLKGELEKRFEVPVKYVLYSHHHWDHASGGRAFADTASFVAHEEMLPSLTPPADGAPLSTQASMADANGDGKLQKDELPPPLAGNFQAMDANGDGTLDGREIFVGVYRDVVPPTETFESERTVTLGNKHVKLVHVGGGHAPDMSLIYFPEEKVLFVVDILSVKRLPFAILGYDERDQKRYLEAALALPFEIVVPGHGKVGGRDDLVAYNRYFDDLREGVRAGIAAGKPLAEIQAALLLEEYKDWEDYATSRPQNIAVMYGHLSRN